MAMTGKEALEKLKTLDARDRTYALGWLALRHPMTLESALANLEINEIVVKAAEDG